MTVNNLQIVGRLTSEPVYKDVGQYRLATFSIAHNRYSKKGDKFEEKTSFFDVTAWNSLIPKLQGFAHKGVSIFIAGYLEEERWQDKNTGENRAKVRIIATEVLAVETKSREQGPPTQQPEFMQSPLPEPPPQHQLPPKRYDEDGGRIIYSSERDNPKPQRPQQPTTVSSGPWTPPAGGEPPF